MKQLTQAQEDGVVRVVDVPAPLVRAGSVLVRTACSLISAGTERAKIELAQKSLIGKAQARPEQVRQVLDGVRQQGILAVYRKVKNRLGALQPLGYSCSGTVLEVGVGAEEFRVGDLIACGGGGYANHAEVNCVPKNLCAPLPAADAANALEIPSGTAGLWRRVGVDEAAFATIGAIALQGVRQADVRLGESAAVIGLGLLGLLTVQMLKAAGCVVMGIDPNPARRRLAERFGCDWVGGDDQRPPRTDQVDAVIITAATDSDEPIALAGRLCRQKGRVVIVGAVGMSVPRDLYYTKELDLRLSRSYGPGRYDPEYEEKGHDYPIGYVRWTERRNMRCVLDLVGSGTLDVRSLITHRFPIDRAADAYRLITDNHEPYLGVLLEYPAEVDARAGRGEAVDVVEPASERPAERSFSVSGPEGTAGGAASRSPATSRVRSREQAAPNARLGLAMIGAGNFASDTLLPVLKRIPQVRLRAVTTASGLTARSVADRYGFERAVEDPADIWSDADIDAVLIATRHNLHARFVIDGLRAGRSVFVEKPMAMSLTELEKIAEAYREAEAAFQAGRGKAPLLQVGFNRRFAPLVREIKAFLPRGENLVLDYRVNAGFLPADHWLNDPEIGGGRLIGEGCHFLDLLIHLAGSPPAEVYAQALPDRGRCETTCVHIRFDNGSIASLSYIATGDKRVGKEHLEVFGGGASVVLDDFRRAVLARGGRLRRLGRWWSGGDKGYRAELEAFVGAALGRLAPPIPFAEAIATSMLSFKALESLRRGLPVAVSCLSAKEPAATS